MLVSWPCSELIASNARCVCVHVCYACISLPSDKLPRPAAPTLKSFSSYRFFYVAQEYCLFLLLKYPFLTSVMSFNSLLKGTIVASCCSNFEGIHTIKCNYFTLLGHMKKILARNHKQTNIFMHATHARALILMANMHPQI